MKMDALLNEIAAKSQSLTDEPRRIFHGRGQTIAGYEHLVIDWYPPVVLITLYRQEKPAFLNELKQHLDDLFKAKLQGVVVQDRSNRDENSMILCGTCPTDLVVTEAGLNFSVRPLSRQNVGFFPDMKTGRQLVRQISRNKKVLNLFAYTCGFSVAAIDGGAKQVVNVDMNANLLEWGRENHRLNNHDLRQVSFIAHNLFKSFGRLKQLGPFEMIIIDPPYRQGDNFRAERDWPKIMRHLPSLLTPDGEIVAAVSAPELGQNFLLGQFREYLPDAKRLTALTAGADFPEADSDKGLHIQHYRLAGA